MKIRSVQEALLIACEMERGAVLLYERALSVMEETGRTGEALYQNLQGMLADEKRHLQQFQEMYVGMDAEMERQLLLLAVANDVLFDGGLLGAVRAGLLTDVDSMLAFASAEEAKAVETYKMFADQSDDPRARRALLAIAAEEGLHLAELQQGQG